MKFILIVKQIFRLTLLFVFVSFFGIICGCGGSSSGNSDDGPGSNVPDISGSYIFAYYMEFTATSYSGYGQCISTTSGNRTESPFVILQEGVDITLDDEACFGSIDENNNVVFYCGGVDYTGTYDEQTGEITGTLTGTSEVTNNDPGSNCTSTGNVTGTFSLTLM